MFFVFLVLLVGFFSFGVEKVSATDWYVSQYGAGGMDGTSLSDTWSGWSSVQWASIQPGDTLYIVGLLRGGTGFNVGATVNGTAGNPITIKGHPSDPGILYEGIEYSDSGWVGGSFSTYNRPVSNCNYNYIREWTNDPLTYTGLTKQTVSPDDTWSPGSYYCDGTMNILHYRPFGDVLVGKNLTVKWYTIPTLNVSGDYITFADLTILHGVRVGTGDPAHHVTFENSNISADGTSNVISVNPSGTSPGSNNGTIINCKIFNGTNGIYLINQGYDELNDNQSWNISHNEIYNISGSADSHAIGIQGGDNHLFEHNIIHDVGSGITFWTQPSKVFFTNGSVAPVEGETITSSSGGTAVVTYLGASLSSGSWIGGDAVGYIRVHSVLGTWQNGDNITGSIAASMLSTGGVTRQTQKNAIVRYNYLYDIDSLSGGNGRGIEYSGDHSENELVSEGYVYGNILNNVEGVALRSKATSPADWYFINNTIRDVGYGMYSLNSNYVPNDEPSFTLANSVITEPKTDGYHVYILQVGVVGDEVSFENNQYYPDTSGTNNRWRWISSTVANYTEWISSSGETGGSVSDPLYLNSTGSFSTITDFTPKYNSPLIDAGSSTLIHTNTYEDVFGNPVYGTPDIGAIEYQPPYTVGTDNIQTTGSIRLYADGQYRELTASSSSETAAFSVAPQGGFGSSDFRAYMDISIDTWSNDTKEWTATSSIATTTVFTINNLDPKRLYTVSVDTVLGANINGECASGICQPNESGSLTVNYTGGWSTHTFTLQAGQIVSSSGGGGALLNPSTPSLNQVSLETVTTSTTTPQLCDDSTTSSRQSLTIFVNLLITLGFISEEKVATACEALAQTSSSTTPVFTHTLRFGDTSDEVARLQHFLNTHGFAVSLSGPGSLGNETRYFGAMTKTALARFQEAYHSQILTPLGLTSATGYFGEQTMQVINRM